jgi:hypothetical protein
MLCFFASFAFLQLLKRFPHFYKTEITAVLSLVLSKYYRVATVSSKINQKNRYFFGKIDKKIKSSSYTGTLL